MTLGWGGPIRRWAGGPLASEESACVWWVRRGEWARGPRHFYVRVSSLPRTSTGALPELTVRSATESVSLATGMAIGAGAGDAGPSCVWVRGEGVGVWS